MTEIEECCGAAECSYADASTQAPAQDNGTLFSPSQCSTEPRLATISGISMNNSALGSFIYC